MLKFMLSISKLYPMFWMDEDERRVEKNEGEYDLNILKISTFHESFPLPPSSSILNIP